jgi:hypothetical protein
MTRSLISGQFDPPSGGETCGIEAGCASEKVFDEGLLRVVATIISTLGSRITSARESPGSRIGPSA